jgi:opacity protein-like surface antigen
MKPILIATFITLSISTPALAAKFIPAIPTAPAPNALAATPAPPARTVIAAASTPAAPAPAAPVRTAPAATNLGLYAGAQVGDSTIGALLGYQFSKMYAMEFSYDYVDPIHTAYASGATTNLEVSRIGVSGLAMFPIKFSEMGPMAIYIKVGYGRTTDTYTVSDPGLGIPAFPATTTVTTTLKTGVTGGAGVNVDLSSNTTARLGTNLLGEDRSVYLAVIYKF